MTSDPSTIDPPSRSEAAGEHLLGPGLGGDQQRREPAGQSREVDRRPAVEDQCVDRRPGRGQLVGDAADLQLLHRPGVHRERTGEVRLPGPSLQEHDAHARLDEIPGQQQPGGSCADHHHVRVFRRLCVHRPPLPSRRPRTLGRPRSGGVPPRWRRWWDSGPSPPAPAGGPFPPPVPPLRDGLTVARAYRRRASAAEGDRGWRRPVTRYGCVGCSTPDGRRGSRAWRSAATDRARASSPVRSPTRRRCTACWRRSWTAPPSSPPCAGWRRTRSLTC